MESPDLGFFLLRFALRAHPRLAAWMRAAVRGEPLDEAITSQLGKAFVDLSGRSARAEAEQLAGMALDECNAEVPDRQRLAAIVAELANRAALLDSA